MNFCSFGFLKSNKSYIFALVILLVLAKVSVSAREYVKVVDGDSLEIGSRRIRLLEIDAPEYKQYCFDSKGERYQCGKKSRNYLDDLLKKANYEVQCYSEKTDIYKRELAECFAGGKSINLEMIKSGWAITYRSERKDYLQAEQKARQYKKGVWQGKFLRPEYYRRLNKR